MSQEPAVRTSRKDPPESLRNRWLEAVILPDAADPRDSCLTELSEYTGGTREEMLSLCESYEDKLRDLWHERPRGSDEDIEDFYRTAEPYTYGLLWWHCLQKGPATAWNARILELALERGLRTCLDFGGGIGSNAIMFQAAGIETTLADISKTSLEFARWRAERRGLSIRFVDLNEQSLDGETFDMVTAIDVIEHVPDHLGLLDHLAGMVAPGGYLCFDVIAGRFDPEKPLHLMRSKYPIRSKIRGMGFRLCDRFGKFLFLQKTNRSRTANRFLTAWDTFRWRLYYMAQGQWPSA